MTEIKSKRLSLCFNTERAFYISFHTKSIPCTAQCFNIPRTLRIALYLVTNPINMNGNGCFISKFIQTPDFFVKNFTAKNHPGMLHAEKLCAQPSAQSGAASNPFSGDAAVQMTTGKSRAEI